MREISSQPGFKREIQEGRLNVVVFRSGQKFDMLGLDNYFGGLFYVINDGDEKWWEFSILKTHEVFQTDPLSLQFFNWMAETDFKLFDDYKRIIFDNTREILESIPTELAPESGKEVCICDFDVGVLSPFIDIKIALKDDVQNLEFRMWVEKRFMELFISEDKLFYRRGSFGFPHANITWIEPKLRINPGLDPSENKIYAKFFAELAEKVRELEEQSA